MVDGGAAPRRGAARAFWIGVLVGALAMAALLTAVSLWRGSAAAANAFLHQNRGGEGVVETRSGLQYKVLQAGTGAVPRDGDVAVVNYRGTLVGGAVFDESRTPSAMPVAGVIPGFAEGLKRMRVGARHRFWIPPALGYGARATGPIPANSVLIFDVELVDVKPAVAADARAASARD